MLNVSTNMTLNETLNNMKESIDDISIINWSNFVTVKSIWVSSAEYIEEIKIWFKFPTGQIIERIHSSQEFFNDSQTTKSNFYTQEKSIELDNNEQINIISCSCDTIGITKLEISTTTGKLLEIKSSKYEEFQRVWHINLKEENKALIGFKTKFSTHLEYLSIYTTSLNLSAIEDLSSHQKHKRKLLNDQDQSSNQLFEKSEVKSKAKVAPKTFLAHLHGLNTVSKIKKNRNKSGVLKQLKLDIITERNEQDELIFNLNS